MSGPKVYNPDPRMAGFRSDLLLLGYSRRTIDDYCTGIKRYLLAGQKLDQYEAEKYYRNNKSAVKRGRSYRKGVRLFIQYINGEKLQSREKNQANKRKCGWYDCFNCPYPDCIEP